MPTAAEPAPQKTIRWSDRCSCDTAWRPAAGQCDRAGALDIVVEAQDFVAIAIQQGEGLVVGEVFPLDQHIGPAGRGGLDEFIDDFIELVAVNAAVGKTQVQRVVQQFFVVGPYIEQNRQRPVGMQTGACYVQHQLADRDTHAVGAQVAQAKNPAAV